MDDRRRRNVQALGRQVPGCLGRMVNLFDFGAGVGGHNMLADKPHLNGSSLLRNRSDGPWMPNPPIGDRIEDKVVISEVRNTTDRVNGTPIKKLIAQEMSKDMDSRLSSNNVVAKLMGLDSVPQPPLNAYARRCNLKGRSRRSLSHEATALRYWEQDFDLRYQDDPECKDVYEIWQQSHKLNNSRCSMVDNGSLIEKKMDVVREKFMEAKRLVTDEKLRHSKEFQDAVEVLSSNKDLFVKFLQESNIFFSQNLHDFQSMATPTGTKRITILKPSKMSEDENLPGQVKKNDKRTNNATLGSSWGSTKSEFGLPFLHKRVEEYPMQSTRIVVLKPNPATSQPVTAKASSCPKSSEGLHGEDYNEELDDFEERGTRDVARRVTKQMHANLVELQRDETLQSSIFSNGYVGDDSSFNRSENGYVAENLSDSENLSPDYINRYSSPFSSSPISRTSCSPESSVCREAKKRLSERWALMASNVNFEAQNCIQKSSSTLGEMLALTDSKKSPETEEAKNNDDKDPGVSNSCLTGNFSRDEGDSNSPRSLQRSKSVPESSTVYKKNLEFRISETKDGGANVPEELTKSRSLKSSLKGKVSNFFFSRSKKTSKEKSNISRSRDDSRAVIPETVDSPAALLAQGSDNASYSVNDGCPEQGSFHSTGQNGSMLSCEVAKSADLSTSQPKILRIASESPISVLETSFEEDDRIILDCSVIAKPASRGLELSLRSKLIDKSPPIGSIARTFSWDDSHMEATTARYATKRSASLRDPDEDEEEEEEEEEEDWHLLVSTLLSATDLEAVLLGDNPVGKWHSAESPLDPSLRNKYAHGAKRQRLRSKRKLVFDLVNSSMLEMATRNSNFWRGKQGKTLGDLVRSQMQEWLSDNEEEEGWGEDDDLSSLAVDRVVRWDVAEKGWPGNMRIEMEEIGTELEGKLLEELVEETLTDSFV